MLPSRRYPTQDEIEVFIARARRMRSIYVGLLIDKALLRVQRALAEPALPRGGALRRYYHDVA